MNSYVMNTSDVKIETEIKASPEVVWDIISNFSTWSDWHKSSVEIRTRNGVPVLLKTQMGGLKWSN